MTQTQAVYDAADAFLLAVGMTQTQAAREALLDLLDAHADLREHDRMMREADARDY